MLILPPERGCVVLDQPQQDGKHRSHQQNQWPGFLKWLRLVFDTPALRGQDAPTADALSPSFLICLHYL